MRENLEIRKSLPRDLASIEALYADAFPEEDLLPLLRDLLQQTPITLSLVGVFDASLAGHIIFTRCGMLESGDATALLGPLAVAPACQRQGIGSALARAGLQQLETAGVSQVYVLGDPAYYGRLGFLPERHVMPPYPLPAAWCEAWQSMSLANAEASCGGELVVPEPWLQPALWAP